MISAFQVTFFSLHESSNYKEFFSKWTNKKEFGNSRVKKSSYRK